MSPSSTLSGLPAGNGAAERQGADAALFILPPVFGSHLSVVSSWAGVSFAEVPACYHRKRGITDGEPPGGKVLTTLFQDPDGIIVQFVSAYKSGAASGPRAASYADAT